MAQNEPDELTAKLQAWKVEPAVPVSFQREVWKRIGSRAAARQDAFWPSLVRWIAGQLATPQHAVLVLALSVAVGIATAHVQAEEWNARNVKALEARYASSISPFAQTHLP